ncbi:MAG: PepSY-associated TM helix domain-containing protein [Bacteroidota bacterium]
MRKLKGLASRTYHVMFHVHTVTGIVISFALYVIFYAGAFALFYNETRQWEDPDLRVPYTNNVDLDLAVSKVDKLHTIDFGEEVDIILPSVHNPLLQVKAIGESPADSIKGETIKVAMAPSTLKRIDAAENRVTVARTIYELHFFDQIPYAGSVIAGFVSLFFFLAIVSGTLVHWRNVLTKFYAFVKEGKWKLIWTNIHTVFGVIGLPFQIMYAITGAFLGLLGLAAVPILLSGKFEPDDLLAKLEPSTTIELNNAAQPAAHLSINELYKKVAYHFPDTKIQSPRILHYGKEDAMVIWYTKDYKGLSGRGEINMTMKDGEIVEEYSVLPYNKSYVQDVWNYTHALHYGNFGGYLIKVLFFVLSMITCFIIISGILIWRTARDNKKYTFKQRRFHHKVTKWYMAISLSMFPAFALLFIANKIVPMDVPDRIAMVNTIFFLGWLLLALYGLFIHNYSKHNRNYLMLGGIFSLLVPICNGLATGDWFWETAIRYPWVFYVDVFWIFTGIIALYASVKVMVKQGSDKPIKDNPNHKKRLQLGNASTQGN